MSVDPEEFNFHNPETDDMDFPDGTWEIIITLETLKFTVYAANTEPELPPDEVRNQISMHGHKLAYMLAERYDQEVKEIEVGKVLDYVDEIEAFANGDDA